MSPHGLATKTDPSSGEANTILGAGAMLPSQVITNDDLSKHLETSGDWIEERVGIRSRRICGAEESSVSLAEGAARQAIESAGIAPSEIELVIFATFTPDQLLPSAAALLGKRLGLSDVVAFDIQAACSGFLFSLITAESLMETLGMSKALVIGADTLSRVLDWEDRSTAVLFGDGAGACVLSRPAGSSGRCVLASHIRTLAAEADMIHCQGPSYENSFPLRSELNDVFPSENKYLQMDGRAVFKAGVQLMSDSVFKVLEEANLSIEQIDWFIPHQSNMRMIRKVQEIIGLPDLSKVATSIDDLGNTSAASIPITLSRYVERGDIKRGDTLLLTAVGSGMSYGSAIVRW